MQSDSEKSRSLVFFLISTFFLWTSMYIYMPVLAVHAQKNLGASMGLVGTILGSYGFTQLVLRVPIGVWSDRTGRRKPFIVAGVGAAALGALGLALSPDAAWLVIWRATTGVGAASWVVFTVLFATYFPPEKATRAMSLITFVTGVSQISSSIAGGVIAEAWGWTAPFFVAAGLGLLGTLAGMQLSESPAATRNLPGFSKLVKLGTVPLLLVVSSVAALTMWTQYATAYGFTPVYAESLGATRSELGLLTMLTQLSFTVASLFAAFLCDWAGLQIVIIAGLLIQAAGSLMVPWVYSIPMIAVSQLLAGAGRGLSYPILMGLSIKAVSPRDRATAMGVFQAVYALGMFAGPATTGVLGDAFGMSSIFILGAVAVIIAVPLVLAKVPRRA